MEITNKKLGNKQLRKIALLMVKASDLGMNLSGYGVADENPNSGYTYLWLEDYPFSLFMSSNSDEVWALWSNPEDGEETVTNVIDGMTLDNLYDWVQQLELESEEV
jgi:hypothetical protein